LCGHPCVPLCPGGLGDITDGEHAEDVEEAVVVVGGVEEPAGVAFGGREMETVIRVGYKSTGVAVVAVWSDIC